MSHLLGTTGSPSSQPSSEKVSRLQKLLSEINPATHHLSKVTTHEDDDSGTSTNNDHEKAISPASVESKGSGTHGRLSRLIPGKSKRRKSGLTDKDSQKSGTLVSRDTSASREGSLLHERSGSGQDELRISGQNSIDGDSNNDR